MTIRAVVGLGANRGSRIAFVHAAFELIAAIPGARVNACSALLDTAPLGPPQSRYVNAAVDLEFARDADALLAELVAIESLLGRTRAVHWGPRTIDCDLLWIDGAVIRSTTLTVPHPELLARQFALAPLVALVPDAIDPRDGARLADRLDALSSDGSVPLGPLDRADHLAARATGEPHDALGHAAHLVSTPFAVEQLSTDDLAAAIVVRDAATRAARIAGAKALRVLVTDATDARTEGLVLGLRHAAS